jgi:tRNA dimethylallyltransferase
MRVVAIVGATATGKSETAEVVARTMDAEIVCADSRQVFRELEIGTGKPTPAERAARPHHLFDALSLRQRPSAGWFARVAGQHCREIHARGRVPLLVGGSGLYLHALRSGLASEPPHDAALRARLQAEAETAGTVTLYERLRQLDPETAARIGPQDTQRVTRALEVAMSSGKPLSWWHRERPGAGLDAEWCIVELVVAPAELAARIETRTRAMFANGLVEETAGLVERGLRPALCALRAVGYDEALELLEGRLGYAAAAARTSQRTRQLAKRQRTWFRHQVQAVRLERRGDPGELASLVVAAARGSRRA